MTDRELKESLLELGSKGCRGSVSDFAAWVRAPREKERIRAILDQIVREGHFHHQDTTGDYGMLHPELPGGTIQFQVSATSLDSPLQMVRSRLETYLRQYSTPEEEEVDVIVGVTEAMENAVKYSDQSEIRISYGLKENVLTVRIVNHIGNISPESDIQSGKYGDSSRTLMRGMMMMEKLFDTMDLEVNEKENEAVFTAHKTLHPVPGPRPASVFR